MGRRGRTWRNRYKTRKYNTKETTCSPKVLLDPEYIQLLKWAKQNGVDFRNLRPAVFHDTGRGLLATKRITNQDCIISVPERLLITTRTVLQSCFGNYLRKANSSHIHTLSTKQLLCLFLIHERYHEKESFWYPYITTLPTSFNTPCYFNEEELKLLPNSCQEQCADQITTVHQAYEEVDQWYGKIFQNLAPTFWDSVTLDNFRWAWFVVNTRSVYLRGEKEKCEGFDYCGDGDNYALAPVLDLLNHNDMAEIHGKFNQESQRYEIHTMTEYSKGKQVFINYGPHNNTKLLLEYGFVLPKNIHNSYKLSASTVFSLLGCLGSPVSKRKLDIIKKNGFEKDLSCTEDHGISWNLWTVLQILALGEQEIGKWDSILHGKVISHDHEKMVANWMELLLVNEIKMLEKESEDVCERVKRMECASDNVHLALQLREQQIKLLEHSLGQISERLVDYNH